MLKDRDAHTNIYSATLLYEYSKYYVLFSIVLWLPLASTRG